MKKYYKIGEIAKLYNMSTDMIRYYESIGILNPKREENGYRIYNFQEIWKINLIRDLRKLNFSMETIKKFFEDRNLEKTLELYRQELEIIKNEILDLKQIEKSINEIIVNVKDYSTVLDSSDIVLKQIPKRECIKALDEYTQEEEIDFILSKLHVENEDILSKIANTLYGGIISKQNFMDNNFLYASVFYVIEENAKQKEFKYNLTLEEGKYLSITYRGEYKKTQAMCKKLLAYARENSLTIKSDLIELYHVDIFETANPKEYVTELQLLVDTDFD